MPSELTTEKEQSCQGPQASSQNNIELYLYGPCHALVCDNAEALELEERRSGGLSEDQAENALFMI